MTQPIFVELESPIKICGINKNLCAQVTFMDSTTIY